MSSHTTSPAVRPLVAAVIAVLLVLASLVLAPPATAHDELLASDPTQDAALDALPAALTLTFSGEIADDAGASEVQVTDAAGTALTAGTPTAQDNVLTQPLAGAASGLVTVLWKVVSSDGHPISGELTFTVTAAPPTPTPTPSDTAEPTPTASETSTPTGTAAPTEPADADSTFAEVWPWVLFGAIAIGLGGAVLYLLVSRVRRDKALAENRERALGDAPGPDSEPPADR